mmetsp:Transcript_22823/g.3748  ORF Transcript_22823/g.3748 Transcript_22823/m.3748 type:complete len:116 (-) Transcript_22823:385-732(-)
MIREDLSSVKHSTPKILAISVNSSNGSLVHAELICKLLKNFQKRHDVALYTFAEDMALGPGYYILSTGNKVFADCNSLLGGFGFGYQGVGLADFAKKMNIKPNFTSSGKDKLFLN